MFQNTLADSTVGELRNWFKNNTDGPYGSQFFRELIERFEELIVERKGLQMNQDDCVKNIINFAN